MSDYKYKQSGEAIRVGDEVTVPSININTIFIVNGYIHDENLRPQKQIDLISNPSGGDPVQLKVNIDLIKYTGSNYTLGDIG